MINWLPDQSVCWRRASGICARPLRVTQHGQRLAALILSSRRLPWKPQRIVGLRAKRKTLRRPLITLNHFWRCFLSFKQSPYLLASPEICDIINYGWRRILLNPGKRSSFSTQLYADVKGVNLPIWSQMLHFIHN